MPYLPSNAGSAVTQFSQSSGALDPWTGLALYFAYAILALVAAALLLQRRDA